MGDFGDLEKMSVSESPEPVRTQNNQQGGGRPTVDQGGRGFGIAALVLGILSLVFFCCCAPIFGILAIIFGILQLVRKKAKAMAIVGLILGLISIGLFGLFWGSMFVNVDATNYGDDWQHRLQEEFERTLPKEIEDNIQEWL